MRPEGPGEVAEIEATPATSKIRLSLNLPQQMFVQPAPRKPLLEFLPSPFYSHSLSPCHPGVLVYLADCLWLWGIIHCLGRAGGKQTCLDAI